MYFTHLVISSLLYEYIARYCRHVHEYTLLVDPRVSELCLEFFAEDADAGDDEAEAELGIIR